MPPLEPGTSYVEVSAGSYGFGALVGNESFHVGVAPGCAGSGPACRLIPRETPQIGKRLPVHLDALPLDVAVLVTGWSRIPGGLDLAALGMPGCIWHVALDDLTIVVGSGGRATWAVDVPDQSDLLGVTFHQQAFVLDVNAGNATNLVVSDAADGKIGG